MVDTARLKAQRRERDKAESELHGLRHSLAHARLRLEQATRHEDAESIRQAEKEIERLVDQNDLAVLGLEDNHAAIERFRDELLEDDGREVERLSGAVPIVLLPVRIETHFVTQRSRVSELRIRVYPDDVHGDSHERELTDEEVDAGQAYWEQIWRAAGDVERRNVAWRTIAEELGAERAAWVAQKMKPLNEAPVPDAPLAPGDPLPTTPEFPDPPRKADGWSRAPFARVLPDRWIALGFRNGSRLFIAPGNPIPDVLALGPDPSSERDEDETLFVDDASLWTTDFDRAEKVGMGIRVLRSDRLNLDDGLDTLLVIGVKASAAPDEGAELFTRLVEAQRFSEGFTFLRRGLPTNNTEAERSDWRDVTVPTINTVVPESVALDPVSNAGRWASALGLNAEQTARAFAGIAGASEKNDEDARAMNGALWPATWGYILDRMAGESVRPHVSHVREHVLKWVRAGGNFASVRFGSQPYGLIVQTDLDRYPFTEKDDTDSKLLGLLRRLRSNFWLPAVDRVPRVGRNGDPERDLAEILGQQAASSSYVARPALGGQTFANLWNLLNGTPYAPWWQAHQNLARRAMARLDLAFDGRLLELGYFNRFSVEIRTLVQEGAKQPGQTLDPNYIDWLLTHSYGRIQREEFPADPPKALLYLLLRQAVLLETARESIEHLVAAQPQFAATEFEPELVDVRVPSVTPPESEAPIVAAPRTGDLTMARVLDMPIAGVTGGTAIGAFLLARRYSADPSLARFTEYWNALEHVKSLPVERLELLLRETLDLSSHRLDAWLGSYAAKLLMARRGREDLSLGVHVGGYGWVEDLKPRHERRSDGYVHAPSNDHAGLAAVLRSAYLSHRESDGAGAFATDLSSERVRLAAWLLDGVREGQSLGALLGYRLERALHEQHPGVELDVFIFALRRRAPLVAGKLEPTIEPFDSVAARNVVDGLALVRLWERGGLSFDADDLPNVGTPEHAAILEELEALRALIDAVGDALLAESVFQIGNPARVGASVDTVASGEVPPPELEFARTPRRGLGLVHRVAVVLPADSTAGGDWSTDDSQVRSVADPTLDAWAANFLGPANRYRYIVRYLTADEGELLTQVTRSLATLPLSALDAVFLAEGEDPDDATELIARIRYDAHENRPSTVPIDARVEVQLEVAGDEITIRELLELARAARQIIQRARPLDGTHFAALGEPGAQSVNLAELETRASTLVLRFGQLETRLEQFLTSPDAASLDTLRDTLLGFHAFGLREAIPVSVSGDGTAEREVLGTQAAAVAAAVASRRRELDQEESEFDAATADEARRVAHAQDRAHIVLGGVLPILPYFIAPNGEELTRSLADQDSLTAGDEQAASTWLQRASRVRERMADINDLLLYGAAVNARDPYSLHVAQLPHRPGALWGALPGPVDREEDANRLSLVMIIPLGFDPTGELAGIVIDEWGETIPDRTETTALTFHFDQPGSRAPNALLLAVAPDADEHWNLDTLEKIVLDTLELAKLRCVDGDALEGLGQFLPALLFASNPGNDTVDMPVHRMLNLPNTTLEDL